MNKPDIARLKKLISLNQHIVLVGDKLPFPLDIPTEKIVLDINAATLVIFNTEEPTTVHMTLQTIKHACTVLICKFTRPSLVVPVQEFLDKNASYIQHSRQMIKDGHRETSLLVRISTYGTETIRHDPITIFLVLKTGGPVYDYRYVNATARNIRQHVTHPHEIVCITDNPDGITEVDRCVKLNNNWFKWWGKLEVFRHDVTTNKHCLFIDLDTVCIKNIDFLCRLNNGFYGLRDFYTLDTFQTGILKWDVNEDTIDIYNSFLLQDFSKYINSGDHEWTGVVAKNKKFLQDVFPGEFCSYKKHLAHITKKFMDPSIVCFHGDPRPHTIRHSFITDVWKY